jgi:hypothetical protein
VSSADVCACGAGADAAGGIAVAWDTVGAAVAAAWGCVAVVAGGSPITMGTPGDRGLLPTPRPAGERVGVPTGLGGKNPTRPGVGGVPTGLGGKNPTRPGVGGGDSLRGALGGVDGGGAAAWGGIGPLWS